MDVHPHKHETEHKRSWKEYISEFLMLFLAVFFGFIAENLRESYTERERGHQYIVSMVNDLQKDTLQLERAYRTNLKVIKGIDSLLFYLRAPSSETATKKLYVYGSYVGASILFEGENGTITQLKNAGGLRLITDTASVNRISSYDLLNDITKKQGEAYYKSTLDALDILEQVMDFSVAANPTHASVFYISKDADKIRYLYNKCYMHNQIVMGYCNHLMNQKKEAIKTIEVLKKKYHIDK